MNAVVLAIIAACAALYAAAAVRTLMHGVSERSRRRRRDRLQDAYLLALAEYLSGPDAGRGEVRFPQSRGRRGKMILAEAIAAFAEMNCGYDCAAMHKIVTDNGVDTFLVRRIARSRSWNRVRYMQLLSLTGARPSLLPRIKRLEDSPDAYVSLFALIIRISSAPEQTIAAVREFSGAMSHRVLSEIMLRLRRGFIPVAYEPMICSDNENLKLLGIYIIRFFGIEEAQNILYAQLDSPNGAVHDAALYTLAIMKSSMTRKCVVQSVAGMSFFQRRRFYKFLAAEGYSTRSLSALQSAETDSRLGGYMESLVNSYKKMLG